MTSESIQRTPIPPVCAAIGAQIALRRGQRGLSASELARRSGVSKGTLSALEAGTGNPTIATLDALAAALGIPITDLLATESAPVFLPGTDTEPGEIKRELLRRFAGGYSIEMWRMRIPAHSSTQGLPHAAGTVEYLYVAAGTLSAGPAKAPRQLIPGDMLAFAGDGPHVYITNEHPVDVIVTFVSPLPG